MTKFYYFSGLGITIYQEPFTCCVITDFIKDPDFVCQLKEDLMELEFCQKSNDLYQFEQVGFLFPSP